MNYTDINAKIVDSWVQTAGNGVNPISHEVFEKARNGEWGVYLTPDEKPRRTNGSARCAARKFWV